MKTLKCDLCDVTAQGSTFEEWMNALMPHYMQAHPEVMNDPNKTKADQQKWMMENKLRFFGFKNGAKCIVSNGTHKGKSGIIQDLNLSESGEITLTVVQNSGIRFKTTGSNISIEE